MTIAEIHGKLPLYDGMEDLLTSDVFSAFRYLHPNQGLVPFLKQAVRFTDGRPADFLDDVKEADYIFWPRTTKLNREPDLLLVLTRADGSTISVVVEAKYRSGKSNVWRGESAEKMEYELDHRRGDQLVEQYVELIRKNIAVNDPSVRKKFSQSNEQYLVYVTAHYARPMTDIHETFEALSEEYTNSDHIHNFYWLNWMSVVSAIEEVNKREDWKAAPASRFILDDLKKLLERKRLVPFQGFEKVVMDVPIYESYFWWSLLQGEESLFFSNTYIPNQTIQERPYFWRGE